MYGVIIRIMNLSVLLLFYEVLNPLKRYQMFFSDRNKYDDNVLFVVFAQW